MSKPDWADIQFDMNKSDSDDDYDEDEKRRQEEAARQAEIQRQNRENEIQRQPFTSLGIDPAAPVDATGLDADIQRHFAEQERQQQEERQRIQGVQRQAMLANLLPGNEGRYTVDAQGIVYDRGRRINGGKIQRKTRRRTRKSKKSKKSRRYRK